MAPLPARLPGHCTWRLGRTTLLVTLMAAATACGDDTTAGGSGGSGGSVTGAGGAATSSGTGATTGSPTASSSSSASTTASSGSGSGGAGGAAPFVLEAATSESDGVMQLTTNLPEDVASCAALGGAPPCDDVDDDGLVDAWEDLVLDRLRPLVILDEDESLVDDPTFAVGLVGRVAPTEGRILVTMMLGYAEDFGSCGGFTGHHGDSERVALSLIASSGDGRGDVTVFAAYTAAHEGTANDHGRTFTGADLAQLTFVSDDATGEPRWAVYASANKHATYGSLGICEGVSVIPCFDEDCGPDGVEPAAYERLFPFVNAGEEAAPRVTDLTALGFPGDDAWAEQDFCGGLGGSGCSAPVRDKLLADPF